jgi:MFS family permease
MARKLLNALVPLGLFFLAFGVYVSSPVVQSADSRWTAHLAASIVHEGNLDLDEYDSLIPPQDYRIQWIGGHNYSSFPLGTPLLAAPLAYLYGLAVPEFNADVEVHHAQAELFIASLITAAAVVLIYGIGRASLSVARSAVLALVFAFATPAWSTTSRALWQHGASLLMLSAVLFILTAACRRPRLVLLAGALLAFSFVIRPTNAISVLVLTIYVFLEHRRYFPAYLLGAALVAAPFLALNLKLYGSPLAPYYMPARIEASGSLLGALAGNLVSPSRGLLIFSPVLLFSAVGVALKAARKELNRLDWSLLIILGFHWLVISAFPKWWGGASYGPRFTSDVLPYIVYFLIPVLAWLGEPQTPAVVAVFFCVTVAASVFIHYRGANWRATFDWNGQPVPVDADPARVWDWRDPQFLRGVAWADGLLPPRVVISPASVSLLRDTASGGLQRVTLRIRLARGTRFDWQGQAGPGITLSPDHAENVGETTIVATFDKAQMSAAAAGPSEIRAQARMSGSDAAWQSIVIPVTLVEGQVRHVFLPILTGVVIEGGS